MCLHWHGSFANPFLIVARSWNSNKQKAPQTYTNRAREGERTQKYSLAHKFDTFTDVQDEKKGVDFSIKLTAKIMHSQKKDAFHK